MVNARPRRCLVVDWTKADSPSQLPLSWISTTTTCAQPFQASSIQRGCRQAARLTVIKPFLSVLNLSDPPQRLLTATEMQLEQEPRTRTSQPEHIHLNAAFESELRRSTLWSNHVSSYRMSLRPSARQTCGTVLVLTGQTHSKSAPYQLEAFRPFARQNLSMNKGNPASGPTTPKEENLHSPFHAPSTRPIDTFGTLTLPTRLPMPACLIPRRRTVPHNARRTYLYDMLGELTELAHRYKEARALLARSHSPSSAAALGQLTQQYNRRVFDIASLMARTLRPARL
ncbi:hypothetical protein V8E36_005200 [Tilletia maclaganii]